jgi:hypothetical protein
VEWRIPQDSWQPLLDAAPQGSIALAFANKRFHSNNHIVDE